MVSLHLPSSCSSHSDLVSDHVTTLATTCHWLLISRGVNAGAWPVAPWMTSMPLPDPLWLTPWPHLLLLPLVTLPQPQWLSSCPLNLTSMLLPQGLCTYCFLCLKVLSLPIHMSPSPSPPCLNTTLSPIQQNDKSSLWTTMPLALSTPYLSTSFVFLHSIYHYLTLYAFYILKHIICLPHWN